MTMLLMMMIVVGGEDEEKCQEVVHPVKERLQSDIESTLPANICGNC